MKGYYNQRSEIMEEKFKQRREDKKKEHPGHP